MKRRALAAAIATLALVTTGCGATAEDADDSGAGTGGDAVATEEGVEADEPTDPDEPTEEAAAGGADEPTVLRGTVGTPDDPEAFEITLTDDSGDPITEIPAGDYVIEVSDPAATHNFHLTGGSVDESTSVPEQEETTFEVTLEPGEYTYTCDPHPSMTGTFTVT